MSILDNELKLGEDGNNEILKFLLEEEHFKEGTGPQGHGVCYRVIQSRSGFYSIWMTYGPGYLDMYTEMSIGGEVSSSDYRFDDNDFEDFREEYMDMIDDIRRYVNDD